MAPLPLKNKRQQGHTHPTHVSATQAPSRHRQPVFWRGPIHAACPHQPITHHELPPRLRCLLHRAFHQLSHSGHAAGQTGWRALRAAGRSAGLPHLWPTHAACGVRQLASQRGDVRRAARWRPPRAHLPAAAGASHRASLRPRESEADLRESAAGQGLGACALAGAVCALPSTWASSRCLAARRGALPPARADSAYCWLARRAYTSPRFSKAVA